MGFFDNDAEKKDDQNTPTPTPPVDNSSEQNQDQPEQPSEQTATPAPSSLGMSDENNNATKYLYRDINGYVRLVDNKLLFTPLLNPEDESDDTADHAQEQEIGPDKIGEVRYTEIVSELRERY